MKAGSNILLLVWRRVWSPYYATTLVGARSCPSSGQEWCCYGNRWVTTWVANRNDVLIVSMVTVENSNAAWVEEKIFTQTIFTRSCMMTTRIWGIHIYHRRWSWSGWSGIGWTTFSAISSWKLHAQSTCLLQPDHFKVLPTPLYMSALPKSPAIPCNIYCNQWIIISLHKNRKEISYKGRAYIRWMLSYNTGYEAITNSSPQTVPLSALQKLPS